MERMEALTVLRLEGRPGPSDVDKAFRNREYELEQRMIQAPPEEGVRVTLNYELERVREAHRVLMVPDSASRTERPPARVDLSAQEMRANAALPPPTDAEADMVQLSLPPAPGQAFRETGTSRIKSIGGWAVRILALVAVLAGIFVYLTQFGPLEDWWQQYTRNADDKREAQALMSEGESLATRWERTAGLLRVEPPKEIEVARKAFARGTALFNECEDAKAITSFLEAKGRFEVALEQLATLREQLRTQGVETAESIQNLFKEIEKAEWNVDRRERDASEEVQRIEESLKATRSRDERRRIEGELTTARAQLGLARDVQSNCRKLVFESDRLPEIEMSVATAMKAIEKEDVYAAMETLDSAKVELEGLLARKDELDRTIVELWNCEQLLEQAMRLANSDEEPLFDVARERLAGYRDLLEEQKFQEIRDGLPTVRSGIELTQRLLPVRRELDEKADRLPAARTFPELSKKFDQILGERESGDKALTEWRGDEAESAYTDVAKDLEKLELQTKHALLERARDNLGKDENRVTKAALAELLRLDPVNTDALNLRKKLSGYRETKAIVVPDDVRTIQAAIQAAKPGETVKVKPGVYEGGLIFKDGVRLEGAGADRVTIRCGAKENNVIKVRNCRSGLISGVTLEHVGSDLDEHRFSCLHIENSSIQVKGVATRNAAGSGILITGGGSTTVSGCTLQGSGWFGIYFAERGGGAAVGNIASRNGFSGIAVVAKDRTVTIRRNQCRNNGLHGIYFGEGTKGIVDDNVVERNRGSGIAVRGANAKPTVTTNECRNNRQFGIYLDGGAAGTVERNHCSENEYSGIAAVGTGASLSIRKNRCVGNRRDGIYFFQGARGTAEENICERNQDSGIAAIGTHPTLALRRNQCRTNKTWGIYFGGRAGGRADGNTCERNTRDGIAVAEVGTTAVLKSNQCSSNKGDGIHFAKGTGGAAEQNSCTKNQGYGIYADSGSSARIGSTTASGNKLGNLGGRARK